MSLSSEMIHAHEIMPCGLVEVPLHQGFLRGSEVLLSWICFVGCLRITGCLVHDSLAVLDSRADLDYVVVVGGGDLANIDSRFSVVDVLIESGGGPLVKVEMVDGGAS